MSHAHQETHNVYGETFAKFYDRYFALHAEQVAPYLLQFFGSQAISKIHPQVIDLGCGTGRLALRFLEAGYHFLGLDISPDMLRLAEDHCWHYVASRKGRFLQEDISHFHLGGPFGMALATYNAINHLETADKLRRCFESVRHSLADGGWFVFDFHTREGLKEWAAQESSPPEMEKTETEGWFDEAEGRAVVRLKGSFEGRLFEETILNQTYPLEQVARWLIGEGFAQVRFSRVDDLLRPLNDPEKEKRVTVLAR